MKQIEIKGELMAYEQIGNINNPNTLLFIHGATMTMRGMLDFAKAFSDYNCIIVDLAGHGGSTGTNKDSVEEHADYIDSLLTELVRTKIVSEHITPIGYSLGGAIAYELALKKRSYIKRMVLLNSGVNFTDHTPIVDQLKQLPEDQFKFEMLFDVAFGTNTTEEQKNHLTKMLLDTKVDDKIGYKDLIISNKYNQLDRASEIEIPTLIISSDEDLVVLPSCGMELRSAIRNSRFFMIPYRGHMSILEIPEYVASEVEEFFRHNA